MNSQKEMNADNATHYLQCRHCIGPNCRSYVMRCHVLKTMADGRLKVKVYGDRHWKDRGGLSKIRYVDSSRVRRINNEVADE